MSEMTISQALRHAKKLKGQLAQLQARASTSVSFQTKNPPAFDFHTCLEKHRAVADQLSVLSARIDITNATTKVDWSGNKITLSQAIRILNDWKGLIAWLGTIPSRPQEQTTEQEMAWNGNQHYTVDVEWKCSLPEAKKVAYIDDIQAQFDRLNDIVESTNGRTPLAVA